VDRSVHIRVLSKTYGKAGSTEEDGMYSLVIRRTPKTFTITDKSFFEYDLSLIDESEPSVPSVHIEGVRVNEISNVVRALLFNDLRIELPSGP